MLKAEEEHHIGVPDRRVEGDLKKIKEYIESRGAGA